MRSNFAFCVEQILKYEGGYSDHPKDPGGSTNLGITRRRLAEYRGVSPYTSLSKEEVKHLKIPEARLIYKKYYWDAIWGDRLPSGVDLMIFDFAVNSGPSRAIKYAQAIVGVTIDGIMGPDTLSALQAYDPVKFIHELRVKREAFLRGLKTFATFGKGWMSRVVSVEKISKSLVKGGAVEVPIPAPAPKPQPKEEKERSILELIISIFLKLLGRM